jgi:hypothetical protein
MPAHRVEVPAVTDRNPSPEAVEAAFRQLGQAAVPFFASVAEALVPIFRAVADSIVPVIRHLVEAFGQLLSDDTPYLLERYAIERLGITEADIRSVDAKALTVRTWNQRSFHVPRHDLDQFAATTRYWP